jgi:benzoyl-CoA reductase/2-hydroxyglutaryl-CoA dehydratase subunit BcrC/BadD/HgdB
MKKLVEEGEYGEEERRKYFVKPVLKTEEKEVFERILVESGLKNLELMRKVVNRPKGMRYFDDIFLRDIRVREVEDFRKKGGKVIGVFCNLVPEELIYAAGAIPIRLCSGFYDAVHPAEEVLPRDVCPLIKSSMGFKVVGLPFFELCDVVVVPTTCDGKKKLGDVLSDYMPVWMLQLPNMKDVQESKELWSIEVGLLKKKIERLTGNKITVDRLRKSIELLHRRTRVFRRFYELRKSEKPVITERDALLVVQASFFDDVGRWIEKTDVLCDELEKNKGRGVCDEGTLRLMLLGSPVIWPNFKLLNVVEEYAVVVADEMCSGTQQLYDPVEVDEYTMEGMLKAVEERYLLPSICPCFTKSDDRIDRLLQMKEDFKVDGVVYHQLRLCQLYDMEFHKVKQVFAQEGIPLLRIQTDYSKEDIEQIRTRVEAFLEMIKMRERG